MSWFLTDGIVPTRDRGGARVQTGPLPLMYTALEVWLSDAIDDRVSKVRIYVATRDPSLRERVEARRRELIRYEESLDFDPARSDADFETLRALATKK